jgi:hypothetical protein
MLISRYECVYATLALFAGGEVGDRDGRAEWGGERAAADSSMTASVTVGASIVSPPATMRRARQSKADGFG